MRMDIMAVEKGKPHAKGHIAAHRRKSLEFLGCRNAGTAPSRGNRALRLELRLEAHFVRENKGLRRGFTS
jgi:hypothetical protein